MELIKQGSKKMQTLPLSRRYPRRMIFVVMSEAVEVEAPARNDLAWTEVSSSAVYGAQHAWNIALLCCIHRSLEKLRIEMFAKNQTASGLLTSPQSWEASSKLPLSCHGIFLENVLESGVHLSNLNSVLQSEDAENAASTDALSWLYHPWLVLNVVDVPAYNALSGILEHTTLRAESVGRSRNKRWTSYLENETKWHDTKQWSDFAAVKSAEQEYAYAEMIALLGSKQNRDNAMRPLALAWENIFSAESYRPNLSKVHWMMSEHEDALRRRILKRINVAFDDHKSASYYESKKMPVIKKAPQADGKVIVSRNLPNRPQVLCWRLEREARRSSDLIQ